jgi:hypothetical protein
MSRDSTREDGGGEGGGEEGASLYVIYFVIKSGVGTIYMLHILLSKVV